MTARKRLLAAAVLLLAGGAAYLLFLRGGSVEPLPPPPEIPSSVLDAEVRDALEAARGRAIADPNSGAAWGELGLLFRAHNLNAESNACFGIAAKFDPRNPRWPYLVGVANLLIDPENAIPHLRAALDLATDPGHQSAIRTRLAEALAARNETDAAASLFADEVRINPRNPRGRLGLGVLATARGDHAAAAAAFAVAAESPFAHKKATSLSAASHRRLGNAAEAERCERDAVRAGDDLEWPDPILAEAMRLEAGRSARLKAAEKLEGEGRLRETVAELAALANANPDDQTLVSLAINMSKAGDDAGAERILKLVVERSPKHAVARYFLGIAIYMQAEREWLSGKRDAARFERAIAELRTAAELKPDKGLAHLYAGLAFKHLGKLPEALEECRSAVRASPQLADTHLGTGEVLVEMKKPEEARPHLEQALRLSLPGDDRAKAALAKLPAAKP